MANIPPTPNPRHAQVPNPPELVTAFGRGPSLPIQFSFPYVYRYMDSAFIEEFFESGRLRLSSFDAFSKHEDEQRKDTSEGKAVVFASSPNQTQVSVIGKGHDAYVLSTSVLDDDALGEQFGTLDRLEIFHPLQFALAIARRLPGCAGSLQGSCHYSDKPMEVRSNDIDFSTRTPDGSIPMENVLGPAMQSSGQLPLFRKRMRFKHQAEYRFFWFAPVAEPFLFIECPEARQYCRRIGAD